MQGGVEQSTLFWVPSDCESIETELANELTHNGLGRTIHCPGTISYRTPSSNQRENRRMEGKVTSQNVENLQGMYIRKCSSSSHPKVGVVKNSYTQ